MNFFEKLKIVSASFAAVVIPIVIAFLGNQYSQAIKDKEARLKLVELSIEILNEKSGHENKGLKNWAIDVLNKYSDVPLNENIKTDLVNDKIAFPESVHTKSQPPNLESVLLKKNLLSVICEANNLIISSVPSSNAYLNSCLKFREAIKQLPSEFFSEMDKNIIKRAEADFKNGNFQEASGGYDGLFSDYYKECTN